MRKPKLSLTHCGFSVLILRDGAKTIVVFPLHSEVTLFVSSSADTTWTWWSEPTRSLKMVMNSLPVVNW